MVDNSAFYDALINSLMDFPGFGKSSFGSAEFVDGVWVLGNDYENSPGEFGSEMCVIKILDENKHIRFRTITGDNNFKYSLKGSINKIRFDGVNYEALVQIPWDGLTGFSLECHTSLSAERYGISALVEETADWNEKYTEWIKDRECIVSAAGDGYDSLFEEELSNLYALALKTIRDYSYGIYLQIEGDYFAYSNSEVQDMSLVGGVHCYDWVISKGWVDNSLRRLAQFVIEKCDLKFIDEADLDTELLL